MRSSSIMRLFGSRSVLRASLRRAALVPLAAVFAFSVQAAEIETVLVTVDHAKVIKLPEKAQTVVIGNPIVADVTVQKNGVMIVTGKSFGVTNLIALDSAGNLIAESLVRVRSPSENVLTVQRGMDRESYSCAPKCQPSVQLGDAQRFFGETGGQASSRNGMASGSK
jgi:Flp pilus assembly secretin CpaC